MSWLTQRAAVPLIQQINAQADEWRTMEISRAKKLLAKGESIDSVLEALARGMSQKMLHGTLAELHTGDAHYREATAQTVSKLFLRGQGRTRSDDAER
jgi:glutamyl-tRNA reductase